MNLEGKTIKEIKIAKDQKALLFIVDNLGKDEEIKVLCAGECCSETWIEHINMPAGGLPATVLSEHDIEMTELGTPDDYAVIDYYGYKIITTKGEIIIDYRNSSNGYYGGNLSWPDDDCYSGGVYNQNVSAEEWVSVKEDF